MVKAIRVHQPGGPDALVMEDVDLPAPTADDVQIRHGAIGVNFIDVYRRTGAYPADYPFVPGHEGAGEVIAVEPAPGTSAPLDSQITLKVSKGNQFVMPNLTGQFWTDAEQNLRGLGWTGALVKGPDTPNSGQRTNAVVAQLPAPGSGADFTGSITLSFAA